MLTPGKRRGSSPKKGERAANALGSRVDPERVRKADVGHQPCGAADEQATVAGYVWTGG